MDSTAIFSTTDTNPNNDSYRELIEAAGRRLHRSIGGSRYWDQASVIIQVQDNPKLTNGFDGVKGHDLVNLYTVTNQQTGVHAGLTSGPALSNVYCTVRSRRTKRIQDNRETASIRLATLDISQLEQQYERSFADIQIFVSFNGIIYIYDSSNTSSTRRGMRIKSGTKIPSIGSDHR